MPVDSKKEEDAITGIATLSKKDHFDKEVGRRIALTRALQNLNPEGSPGIRREFNKQVWEAYRNLTKVPRWGANVNKIYKEATQQYSETLNKLSNG